MSADNEYTKLSAKMALQIAAPHTWAASIMPVLIAVCAAIHNGYPISIIITFALLFIAILMQSAANALNDYFDFVKGTDSASDNVEESDAVLVYNNIKPSSVRSLAIAFVVIAFLLGIPVIIYSGLIPLVIAIVGVVIVFLYSGGKTPISYLPIGEIVSGVVMGCLITFASYVALTKILDWAALVWSFPLFIGIALIMLTNNTCDIEKDIEASRKTLPTLIGRDKSRLLYRVMVVIWYVAICVIVICWFAGGILLYPFLLLATLPLASRICKGTLAPASRVAAMSQISMLNIMLGSFYAAAILCGGALAGFIVI